MSQEHKQWRKWCLQKQRSNLLSEVLKHFTLQKRKTATGKTNYSPDIYHSARQSKAVLFLSFRSVYLIRYWTQSWLLISHWAPHRLSAPQESTSHQRDAGKCIPTRKSLFLHFTMRKWGAGGSPLVSEYMQNIWFYLFFSSLRSHIKLLCDLEERLLCAVEYRL